MAEYIVNSADQASESLLVEYRNARVGAQTKAARVYMAIDTSLQAEDEFNAALQPGGPLESLATYHAAKLAPVQASLDALRAAMIGIQDSMRALETAVPGLFPGVPTE